MVISASSAENSISATSRATSSEAASEAPLRPKPRRQIGAVVMAKRKSKQDVGAKQDAPPLFDYSQAEWSEIKAAAPAILPDDKPLPNEVREALVARFNQF